MEDAVGPFVREIFQHVSKRPDSRCNFLEDQQNSLFSFSLLLIHVHAHKFRTHPSTRIPLEGNLMTTTFRTLES